MSWALALCRVLMSAAVLPMHVEAEIRSKCRNAASSSVIRKA